MTNLKEKSVLVIDSGGEYISIAQRLARDFDTVFYCTMWVNSFPKFNTLCVGLNVPDITRIDSPFEVLDDVDLIVIPDLYLGAMADWLRDCKKVIFGSGCGENLEINRDEFYNWLDEVELPTPEYKVIKGVNKLRNYLKDKENKWVKMSLIRGNAETWNYKNARLSESRLDALEHDLGAYKNEVVFVVTDSIDNCVEIGHDTFSISGKFPQKLLMGIEIKDCGYAGKVMNYEKLPEVLKTIDKKIAPFFKETTYNGFFSTEVRYDGKKGYFGDITLRAPQPPSDLQCELFDNFSEIIWDVAHGVVPEIKASKPYGVQIIIKSDWATSEAQAIYFPEKYAKNVKIKHLMIKDGIHYYVPSDNFPMQEIGSVVATGNSLQEAIDLAKKIAKEVEGDCVHVNSDALDEAEKEIQKFKKFNLPTI